MRKRMPLLKTSSTRFVCQSIFDFPSDGNGFDVISGQGLIGSIFHSLRSLKIFWPRLPRCSSPAALPAIGSRNRLFNVVSLNDYTRQEMDLGVVEGLIDESIFLANEPKCEYRPRCSGPV